MSNTSDFEESIFDIRTKVDRKVLELMLNGGDSTRVGAQEFFVNVSNETGVIIAFPQLLKLKKFGRKEPEIRLIGTLGQIQNAKQRVLEVMDPHKNKVTLKIDVSYTDHSHIIGRGGKRIQSIMNSTDCHIHFPDCNRTNTEDKSNQVTIAGTSLKDSENARHLIRQYLPLTINFQIEINALNMNLLDSSNTTIQYIQNKYNVVITFRYSAKTTGSNGSNGSLVTILVRGTRLKFEDIREAMRYLYEYFNGSHIGFNNLLVTLNIEVAPQHHSYVMGRGNCNVKSINDHTGAVVSFPDLGELKYQSSTVTIRGRGIESAFMAWLELLGYLPMVLVFDLKPDQELDGRVITSLMSDQLMNIVIRQNARTSTKSILIKIQERNSELLFTARKRILKEEQLSQLSTHKLIATPCSASCRQPSGFPRYPFALSLEPEILRAFREFLDPTEQPFNFE